MSEWISFVKNFARENGLPYNEALQRAAPFYHGQNQGMGVAAGGVAVGGRRKRKPRRSRAGNYDRMAADILGYGGAQAQKGALAALLQGLDAQVKIN